METYGHLNPKYIKTEVEVKREDTTGEITRIGIDQTIDSVVEIEVNSNKVEVDVDFSKVIGEIIIGKIQVIMEDKAAEESIEVTVIEMIVMIEVGTGLEKGHFPGTMTVIELEVQAIVDYSQDLEQVQTGIEKDVISVGNMIISQETVPPLEKKESRTTPTDAQSGIKPNLSTDKYTE